MINTVYIIHDTDNGESTNRGVYASRDSAIAAAIEIADSVGLVSDADICGSIIAQWIHPDYDTVLQITVHTVSA